MIPFSAKKEVMRTYLSRHEDKLRATPEDWALAIMDLAERPDVMYDQHTFEKADYARRPWGLHFEIEVEALAKLEDRNREKQQSQQPVATGRRGMLWVAEQDNSPNWPLDLDASLMRMASAFTISRSSGRRCSTRMSTMMPSNTSMSDIRRHMINWRIQTAQSSSIWRTTWSRTPLNGWWRE